MVDVIVIKYHNEDFLDTCIHSLQENNGVPYRIILVDNTYENRGYANGNNYGAVEYSSSKYLFFLNADTTISPHCIYELFTTAESDPAIAICCPKILDYSGKDVENCTGKPCDIFGWQGWKGKPFFAEGSCLFIRRDVFFKLQGFDERYFMYLEDIDLAWRVRLLGYKVAQVHSAIVYHYAGGNTNEGRGRWGNFVSSAFKRYHGEKNQLCTLLKNYSILSLAYILPLHMLISLGEMAFLALTFKWNILKAYLQAYKWNYDNLHETLRKRKHIQRTRKVPDKEIQRYMLKHSAKIETLLRIGFPKFR